jgi:hypothetical protein
MTIRGIVWVALMTLGGIMSAAVTLYGVYSTLAVDLRQSPVLIGLYCLLAILCFPMFLLIRPARRSAALLVVLACGYLIVYSALSWRTCAELGYCGSVLDTVVEIFKTRTALAYFGAAILRSIAAVAENHAAYGGRG